MSKISAVIISRNDENTDIWNRTIISLNTFINSVDEVVFVDWNSKVPTLNEIGNNIFHKGKLKHIVVTPEQVKQITGNRTDVPNVSQPLARNVGLRRCTGDILISTNIDIICPPRPVIDQFELDLNTFYTIPRRNFQLSQIMGFTKISDILNFLMQNKDVFPQEPIWNREISSGLTNDNYSLINCCGDFQIACKDIWYKVRGFEEAMIYRNYDDTNVQIKAAKSGYNLKTIPEFPVFHMRHPDRMGTSKANDWEIFGNKFEYTKNPETWGYTTFDFKTEII
jgi:hypothetical protein